MLLRLKLLLILLAILPSGKAQDAFEFFTDDTAPIGDRVSIHQDVSRTLRIHDVLDPGLFESSHSPVPNLGLSASAHWLKLDVIDRSGVEDLVLNIANPDIDEIDVYLRSGEQIILLGRSGQSMTLAERSTTDPEFAFRFKAPINELLTLYMRVVSHKQLQLPIYLRSDAAFAKTRSKRNLYLGVFIGILLTLALYNFFIYLAIHDKSYLLYVLYIVAVAFTQLAFTGIAPFYFWNDMPWFSTRATVMLTIITALLASEFTRQFLHTKDHVPRLHGYLKPFYLLFLVCIVLSVLERPLEAYKMTQLVSGLFAYYLLYMIYRVWRHGSRTAGFFLVAWSAFLIGTIVFVLKDMGLLPYNDITVNMMPFGSAIEGILLSLALADRINILRREKEQSQAEALRISLENEKIIREQNLILEEKVKLRTHALEESNDHLKRTQTQLVNAEKMASLGQLTAGIAHEINNPINFITSNIHPLRRNISEIVEVMQEYRGLRPEEALEKLPVLRQKDERLGIQESIEELDGIIGSIAEGSARTAEIVRGLRNFSRLDENDLKDSDLNEGIRSTVTVLAPQFREKVGLHMELAELPPVECYPGKINQVFMNILTNAIQATMARQDAETRTVSISTEASGEHVIICIKDNGIGMTDEVKARIFDPFFTTKPVGEGTGLGMAIVYGIIQDHFGDITIDSIPGEGTEFKVILPVRHTTMNERRA